MSLTDQLTALFSKRHRNNNPENPLLKPASIKKYVRELQLLAKALNVEFVNLEFLKEPSKVFKAIENQSEPVKASRLLVAMLISEMMPEYQEFHNEYTKMHKSVARSLADKFANGIQTEKTKKNMSSWNEILDTVKEHKKSAEKIFKILSVTERKPTATELKTIRKYVVAMLVAGSKDLPPRRAEYGDVEIIKNTAFKKLKEEERNTKNYLVIGNKSFFHFANFKTVDTQGIIDIPIPSEVMKVLRKWISLQNSKYLFTRKKDEALGFQDFALLVRNTFSTPTQNIGINILRHAFITEHIKTEHDEHKEIANLMGHDVNTQKGYIANDE